MSMRKKRRPWQQLGMGLAIATLAIGLLPTFGASQAHAATTVPTLHQITSSQFMASDGKGYTWAIKSDHTLWNVNGPLYTPVQFDGPAGVGEDVAAASLNPDNYASAILHRDGTLWVKMDLTGNAWTQVDGISNARSVSAGANHVLVLTSDGNVYSIGHNEAGQLGNGTTTNTVTPIEIPNLSDVTSVVAGNGISFFVKSDGTVFFTGSPSVSYPQTVPVQLDGVSDVKTATSPTSTSAGSNTRGYLLMFLKNDGTVYKYTSDLWIRTINGYTAGDIEPALTQISGVSDIVSLSYGSVHYLMMKSDGTVLAGGNVSSDNSKAALGNPDVTYTGYTTDAVQVPGISTAVDVVAGTDYNSFIQLADGTIRSFGKGGVLGDGTTTMRTSPVTVLNDVAIGDPFNIGNILGDSGSDNSETDSDDPSDNVVDQDSAVSIGSGGLSMTSSGDKVDFGQLAFSDASQVASSSAGTFDVSDLRGTGDGWHVSVLADPHSSDSNIIPAGSLTLKAPTVSALNGAADDVSSAITDPVLIDTDTAVNVASADVTKGQGAHRLAFTDSDSVQLNVPANTPVGDYKSNIHWQLTTGP